VDNRPRVDEGNDNMKSSEAWVKKQTTQNAIVRVAQQHVMQSFGPRHDSAIHKPMKKDQDRYFIVGETEIGGEEEV
jgi:hypothetical protein